MKFFRGNGVKMVFNSKTSFSSAQKLLDAYEGNYISWGEYCDAIKIGGVVAEDKWLLEELKIAFKERRWDIRTFCLVGFCENVKDSQIVLILCDLLCAAFTDFKNSKGLSEVIIEVLPIDTIVIPALLFTCFPIHHGELWDMDYRKAFDKICHILTISDMDEEEVFSIYLRLSESPIDYINESAKLLVERSQLPTAT